MGAERGGNKERKSVKENYSKEKGLEGGGWGGRTSWNGARRQGNPEG